MLGIGQSLVRHGVIAAFCKRVTTQQAPCPKPDAAQHTVSFDGGVCVARTAGIEAAARTQHGADRELIAADDPQEGLARLYHRCVIDFQCWSRLARRSPALAMRAASRAETVTSTGGKECWFKRKDSRARRLMRLRATAVPKVRVAILKPNRGKVSSLARTDRLKNASANFLPRRFTSRNSAGWCKRLRGSNVSLRIVRQP
jgi:hypothetical protein